MALYDDGKVKFSDEFIEEDLMRSSLNGVDYYKQNSLEIELVEIEIEYKIKKTCC